MASGYVVAPVSYKYVIFVRFF